MPALRVAGWVPTCGCLNGEGNNRKQTKSQHFILSNNHVCVCVCVCVCIFFPKQPFRNDVADAGGDEDDDDNNKMMKMSAPTDEHMCAMRFPYNVLSILSITYVRTFIIPFYR